MEDLYSSNPDLFVAGMAAGGSGVAVFSFHRYHPLIRMSPEDWHDVVYVEAPPTDSYFEPCERPSSHQTRPPAVSCHDATRLMLSRACKLLVHELCHLYGLDHCIFHACLMQGTGHLGGDFAAPHRLCVVCLRKLQFRLGFNIVRRYQQLQALFSQWELHNDSRWLQQRIAQCTTTTHDNSDEQDDSSPPAQNDADDAHDDSPLPLTARIRLKRQQETLEHDSNVNTQLKKKKRQ